jgi:hypothetical protein
MMGASDHMESLEGSALLDEVQRSPIVLEKSILLFETHPSPAVPVFDFERSLESRVDGSPTRPPPSNFDSILSSMVGVIGVLTAGHEGLASVNGVYPQSSNIVCRLLSVHTLSVIDRGHMHRMRISAYINVGSTTRMWSICIRYNLSQRDDEVRSKTKELLPRREIIFPSEVVIPLWKIISIEAYKDGSYGNSPWTPSHMIVDQALEDLLSIFNIDLRATPTNGVVII